MTKEDIDNIVNTLISSYHGKKGSTFWRIVEAVENSSSALLSKSTRMSDKIEGITNFVEIGTNSEVDMRPEGDFFQCWVEFLKPLHKLTKKEMVVLAQFLKVRYNLSKEIISADRLDRVLMSPEIQAEIRDACGIKQKHLEVIRSKFRKNRVLVNGRIRQHMIPAITKEGAGLMVHFSFGNEQHAKSGYKKSS